MSEIENSVDVDQGSIHLSDDESDSARHPPAKLQPQAKAQDISQKQKKRLSEDKEEEDSGCNMSRLGLRKIAKAP